MPTNQLAPPDMPWLTGNVANPPNGLGPPLLNYAAPPDATTSQGADALAAKAQQAWQWLQDQRAESVRQGLLDPNTGLPTQKGVVQGVGDTAQGVMMGTTAPGDVPPPGIVAYHGSPHSFDQFDSSKLHPDEAGHYVTQDEKLAQDYAGRSARDPTAGHMYEVNVKADPAQFLDYGSMKPEEQAALNDPGAVQKLRDAGVPGITFPGGTHVVFDASTIDILRKYGIVGLIAGGGAAAAGTQQQQPPTQ